MAALEATSETSKTIGDLVVFLDMYQPSNIFKGPSFQEGS